MADKTTREELIAALTTDKYSGFKEVDTAMLGSASETRLEEFRAAAEARRNAATESERAAAEARQTAANLRVAQERLAKAESTLSDEDFVARLAANSPIRALIETRAAEDKALKAQLVASLKDLGSKTEEQLNKMSIDDLKDLAQYARVKIRDFSGRGIPAERSAEGKQESFAAPKPWTAAIEAQKQAAKA